MANELLERDFYNEEIKLRYLGQKEFKSQTQYGNIERMLLKATKFEREYEKDASCFSVSEVQDMLKRLNFISVYSFTNFRCQLFKYTQWCIAQNLVDSYLNNYDSIYVGDASQYVSVIKARRKVIARTDLLSALEKLYNPSDMYAILGIFEGINGENRKEILNLRTTDIDITKQTVSLCTDRKIFVSRKLIDLAFEAADTEKYTALSGRQITFAIDPTLVFKEFNNSSDSSSEFYKGRRLYFRLVKCLGSIGLDSLSINSISDSGKIHMINEIAETEGITGKEVIDSSELLCRVERQFGQRLWERKSSFLSNYEEYLAQ